MIIIGANVKPNNHRIKKILGEKKVFLPIFDVPNIWIKKRSIIITTVIGKIHLVNASEVVVKPSIADKTLIAGVKAPSPKLNKRFISIIKKSVYR